MTRHPFAAIALSGTLIGALTMPAAAETYGTLDKSQSRINFTYSQMGVSVAGRFRRFDAKIHYDPATPETARTLVEVPVSAIDTGVAEGDQEAQGKDWFNAARFPVARFESNSVKALGSGKIALTGTLSIKDKRSRITVPVRVAERSGKASFDGSFTLDRTDFGIGAGMWADDEVVAHPVEVRFHLVATP